MVIGAVFFMILIVATASADFSPCGRLVAFAKTFSPRKNRRLRNNGRDENGGTSTQIDAIVWQSADIERPACFYENSQCVIPIDDGYFPPTFSESLARRFQFRYFPSAKRKFVAKFSVDK